MNTTDIKEFSQLAQAAYSWFDSGDYYYNDPAQGGAISKMMTAPNGAFPEKEASLFADRYVVLYQYRDDNLNPCSPKFTLSPQAWPLIF